MAQIHIEMFEFALLINHDEGLTVIFPEIDHILMIKEQDGTTTAIARGADLELCGPGGVALPAAKPTATADYAKFVVDMEAAEAAQIPVPPALLDPATKPDRNRINGRLFLKGGTITGKECSIPGNRTPFTFKGGDFLVTDTAEFTLDIPAGQQFVLTVNGQPAIKLPDGSRTRIMNSDALGGDPKPFESLDEFLGLCAILGHSGTPPSLSAGRIRPMGGEVVCANAQITFIRP